MANMDIEFTAVDANLADVSEVSKFYNRKAVFVTGASGFMGKVLVEKLLFACPGITKIYILMRPRKEITVQTRLEQMLNSKVFQRIANDVLKKVVVVEGDISLPDLGLAADDRARLQDEVSVVFHSAATVRFHEPLKKSLTINLLGTKRVVELALGMKKLKSFLHVSTAYAHCNHASYVEEVIYPNPRNIRSADILSTLDWMDEDLLEKLAPDLTVGRPNTYTLTKAITETYIQDLSRKLTAVAIVRPSIVSGAWREPMPGWVDSLNGVTGGYIAAYLGFMKAVKFDRSVVGDFVPVDIVINLIIVAAWKAAKDAETRESESESVKVYNCSSNGTNPLYWSTVEDVSRSVGLLFPSVKTLRYPRFTTYSPRKSVYSFSNFIYQLDILLRHYFPAIALDAITKISGGKPRLCDYLSKALKGGEAVNFFATRDWKFDTRNMTELYSSLPEAEQKLFPFDINNINWTANIENNILGIRRYIINENDNTVIEARKKLKILRYIDWTFDAIIFCSIAIALMTIVRWSTLF